jgi:YVTN family beta-propeller protein
VRRLAALAAAIAVVAAACSGGGGSRKASASRTTTSPPTTAVATTTAVPGSTLPGMPPLVDPNDVYAADRPGQLSAEVKDFPNLVYVPNSESNTVDVIDPNTFKVVDHFPVGRQPQHVVPSYDLKTLYATNDLGNSLTPIDPRTGKPSAPMPVEDPYNMYFTPDGRFAIVVAERLQRLDFRDAHTMHLERSLPVPCKGIDHMDFSADGRYLIASCEFAGAVLKVDVANQAVMGRLLLKNGGMPQDVKLSPDGKVFYVADQVAGGVFMVDGESFKDIGFLPTGRGAHGLYVSRDSKFMYVSNRREGSISVVDFATRAVSTTWHIPGGGSPDMGGVSTDGKVLWLSGRYNSVVYAIDTATGAVIARVPVGRGPHGLCVYPQPGRYSLGHTGVFR